VLTCFWSAKFFLNHQNCGSWVKSLERKIPNLDGIDTPASFERLMRDRGFQVQIREMPETEGSAFEVIVPEKGLALLFVKRPLCKGFIEK
jgi:hypothetical protein